MCETSLGAPVVPEVSKTHSVRSLARRMRCAGAISAEHADEARGLGRAAVADYRVDFAGRDHRGQVLVRHVRRAQHDAPGNPVEFDQRQGGGKLVARRDQDRGAAQLVERRANARPA